MKIENLNDFEKADKEINLVKISADEIEITEVDDIWDGPLSGSCVWKQKEYYFFSFAKIVKGEDKQPRTFVLINITPEHKSALEKLRSAYIKRQHRLISEEEYVGIYASFPKQTIRADQAIGWFEAGTIDSKFMESYFSWKEKVLPLS